VAIRWDLKRIWMSQLYEGAATQSATLCSLRTLRTVLNEMLADSVPWGASDDSDDELLLLLSLCKRLLQV
jgi:hypothetical protein